MIVGKYYINNFFLAFIVICLLGAIGYMAGVPGGGSPSDDISGDYELVVRGEGLISGTSQAVRLVSTNGSAVSNADVSVNGEEVGETGENGGVSFQVPAASDVTVTASKSGFEVSKTFEVDYTDSDQGGSDQDEEDVGQDNEGGDQDDQSDEEGENEAQNDTEEGDDEESDDTAENRTDVPVINTPDGGETFSSKAFTLDVVFDGSNASYQIDIDGETRMSGQIDGRLKIEEQVQVDVSGTHQLSAIVIRDDEILYNQTIEFTVEPSDTGEGKNGFYLTENLTAKESAVVRLWEDDSLAGGKDVNIEGQEYTTDQYGEISFTVPNLKEVTLSSENFEETFSVQGYTGEGTALASSVNILDPDSGQEIQKPFYFNATVDSGLADSYEIRNSNQVFASGSLTENSTNTLSERIRPQTSDQTLEFVVRNSENENSVSRSVDIDVWELVQITSPAEGESFSSNEISFEFSLSESVSGEYAIFVDSERKYSASLGSSTGYSKDLVVADSGDHTVEVQINASGETYTDSKQFVIEEDAETSITTLSPETYLINTERFTWNVTYPGEYWTYLLIDGEVVDKRQRYGDAQVTMTGNLTSGLHNWEALVKDEETSESSISTSETQIKYVDIQRQRPDQNTVSSPVQFEYDIQTGESTEASLVVNGSELYSQELSEGLNTLSTSEDLGSGEKEFYVSVRDEETGQTVKSSNVTVEVQ